MPAYCHRFVADVPPFFRLIDGLTTAPNPRSCHQSSRSLPPLRTFQPRFDVREDAEAFHLIGELAGVAASDVTIEFTDQNTLLIKGRRHRNYAPAAEEKSDHLVEAPVATAAAAAEESSDSSKSHAPTVEDEDEDYIDAAVEVPHSESTEATMQADIAAVSSAAKPEAPAAPAQTEEESRSSKYWVSERVVGEFRRSFSFQAPLDQAAVRANLKDGILSIVLPKKAEEKRRIRIE